MTLTINPNHAPFTPSITIERAVAFNLEDRLPGVPHKSMAQMMSSLLEELAEREMVLDRKELGRILNLDIISIQ